MRGFFAPQWARSFGTGRDFATRSNWKDWVVCHARFRGTRCAGEMLLEWSKGQVYSLRVYLPFVPITSSRDVGDGDLTFRRRRNVKCAFRDQFNLWYEGDLWNNIQLHGAYLWKHLVADVTRTSSRGASSASHQSKSYMFVTNNACFYECSVHGTTFSL